MKIKQLFWAFTPHEKSVLVGLHHSTNVPLQPISATYCPTNPPKPEKCWWMACHFLGFRLQQRRSRWSERVTTKESRQLGQKKVHLLSRDDHGKKVQTYQFGRTKHGKNNIPRHRKCKYAWSRRPATKKKQGVNARPPRLCTCNLFFRAPDATNFVATRVRADGSARQHFGTSALGRTVDWPDWRCKCNLLR